MKFPKVVAAFAAMEKSQWRIGDALLEEVPLDGDPASGKHTGAWALLEVCHQELQAQGHVVTLGMLKDFRRVAAAFPPSRRRNGVSFYTHKDAGTPEMLDAIIKVSGSKKPDKNVVRDTKPIVHQHIARQSREQHPERRKPTPRGNRAAIPISKQETSALRVMAEAVRWTNDLEDCDRTIVAITTLVADNLTKLDDTEVDHLIEVANEIAKHAHKLNDVAQKLKARHERKGHLNVVA